jgi:serine/threonine protein kinase
VDALKPSDPKQIGDIRLLGRLGRGGMGLVYFGVTEEGDPVAVKVILPVHADTPAVRERFNREIVALRMVQGAGIASIVDASGEDAEQPWLAVEYIRGMTLREYVDSQGPLGAEMGAMLGVLLAEALAAVHQAGLLHRDLTPRNILLGQDGPKVIDFGLVSLTDHSDLTGTAEILGTPGCLSPEQITSPKDVTQAADVYGLAASLLFGVTGHFPFERGQVHALLFAISDPNMAPDLSRVPTALEPVITDMLGKEPESRPHLAEVTDRLGKVVGMTGTPLSMAQLQLARLTYAERPDDPPLDTLGPTTATTQTRRRPRPEPRVPTPIVGRLSDRLRRGYARGQVL